MLILRNWLTHGLQVFAVTVDNAENNTTMLKEMHELVPEFRGESVRVRCFGHVLNLVVKVYFRSSQSVLQC